MKAEAAIPSRIKIEKAENRVPAWVMPLTKAAVFAVDGILAGRVLHLRVQDAVERGRTFLYSLGVVERVRALRRDHHVRDRGSIGDAAVPAGLQVQRGLRLYARGDQGIQSGRRQLAADRGWAFLFRGGFAFRDFSYSRAVFVLDFAAALVVFGFFHLGLRFVQSKFREQGINLLPTLIVGTNAEAEQTIRELREQQHLGYRVIGVIDGNGGRDVTFESDSGVPVIGGLDDLAGLISELEIQEVIITDNSIPSERLFDAMLQIGRRQRVEFRFAPSLFNLLPQKTSVEQIGVLPMVRLFREPLSDVQRFVKRISDIVISTIAIVLLTPIWLVISILIKLDSKARCFSVRSGSEWTDVFSSATSFGRWPPTRTTGCP